MLVSRKLIITCFLIIVSLNSFSQRNIVKVGDISSYGFSTVITEHIIWHDTIFFGVKEDNSKIVELWKSDGQTNTLIKTLSTSGGVKVLNFIPFNDVLLFIAQGSANTSALWQYDGVTATEIAGTDYIYNDFPRYKILGNELVFSKYKSSIGSELWKYDGSSVSLIKDINVGSGSPNIDELIEYNGELIFSADDGVHGFELWLYDGTEAKMLKDIYNGSKDSKPDNFHVHNNKLYFAATDADYGSELWEYDGNNVTRISDISVGAISSSPYLLGSYKNQLIFWAADPINGAEPRAYDGTNITLIKDFNPGSNTINGNYIEFNGDLLIITTQPQKTNLWQYDGTSTNLISSIYDTNSFYPTMFLGSNEAYFIITSFNKPNRDILFKYDGTELSQIYDSLNRPVWNIHDDYLVLNDELIFTAMLKNGVARLMRYYNNKVSTVNTDWLYRAGGWPNQFFEYHNKLYFTGVVGSTYAYDLLTLECAGPNYGNITTSACGNYTFPSGKQTVYQSGNYTDTIYTLVGCDSIITINLTIEDNVSDSVTQSHNTLTAFQTDASYQWINCSDNSPINGDTNTIFTPTVNGSYAVIISRGNCKDTSDCYSITQVSSGRHQLFEDLRYYPNPTEGSVNIYLGDVYISTTISVKNTLGQIITRKTYHNTNLINLQIPDKDGIYFIEITTDEGNTAVIEVIKE